jgi:hypothetical protein
VMGAEFSCRYCGSVLTHKRCTDCGQELPVSEFYRRGPHDPRPVSECRSCRRARARIQRIGTTQPDWMREYMEDGAA